MSTSPSGQSATGITPTSKDFRPLGNDTFEADLRVSEPDTAAERLQRVVFGNPIPENLAGNEQLDRIRALAILSSDALSSVAYGTEASLAVLVVAGAAALSANLGIGLVTAFLMLIVGASYQQTIHAYPSGGGSYIVARANIGAIAGLIAAAALLVDYLLTVSVSVAAGIDAIASALPVLTPYTLWLDIGAIVFITLINLRGLRESGTVFALPTYLFLFSFGLMLVLGIIHAFQGGLATPVHPSAHAILLFPGAGQSISLLLILTAFASGCSAMTGVEAISNGVPVFKGEQPQERSRNAASTLAVMIVLLASFFLGTTYLAWRFGAIPSPTGSPTVTAQIASAVFTGPFSWLFYIVQAATLLILVFAANTSFADFPRLLSILARDSFAPALFSYRGERLAFTAGICVLGVLSAGLLWIFRGDVTNLINLYALGVFTAFTLSQTGMVLHWWRRRNEAKWRRRIAINSLGAFMTGVVTVVIAVAKFDRGAWVTVIIIPTLVFLFLATRRYYERPRSVHLDAATRARRAEIALVPIFSHQPLPVSPREFAAVQRMVSGDHRARQTGTQIPPSGDETQSVVRSAGEQAAEHTNPHRLTWPQVVEQELDYALDVAPKVIVLHVVENEHEGKLFRIAWQHYLASQRREHPQRAKQLGRVDIEILVAPYRTIVLPLVNFIRWRCHDVYKGRRVAVLLPRQINRKWWEWPLQRRVARRVRRALQADGDIKVIDVPYTLGKWGKDGPAGQRVNDGPTDNPAQDAALGQTQADGSSQGSGDGGAETNDAGETIGE